MEQNQHPKTWDETFAWIKSGELEVHFEENKWRHCGACSLSPDSDLRHFRRKPTLRPYTAEEIKRGPVEFWAAVWSGGETLKSVKCCLSHGEHTKEMALFREYKDSRVAHFREVLPPLELTEEQVKKIHTGWCNHDAAGSFELIRFVAAEIQKLESARFEKGK